MTTATSGAAVNWSDTGRGYTSIHQTIEFLQFTLKFILSKSHYKSNDSHLDSLGLFIYSLIFWVSDAAWWLFHHIYSSNMNHPLQL